MALDITTLASTDKLSNSRGDINTNFTNIKTDCALTDQSMFIGTTEVAINRGTGTLNLAGIGTLACGTITTSDDFLIDWTPSATEECTKYIKFQASDGTKNPQIFIKQTVDIDDNVHKFIFDSNYSNVIGYADFEFLHGDVSFSSGNLSTTGTLACGAIDTSGDLVMGSNNISGIDKASFVDAGSYIQYMTVGGLPGLQLVSSNDYIQILSGTSLKISGSDYHDYIRIYMDSTNHYANFYVSGNEVEGLRIQATDYISLYSGGAEALQLDSSQNATLAGTLACGAITTNNNFNLSWIPSATVEQSKSIKIQANDGTKNPQIFIKQTVDIDDNVHKFIFDSNYNNVIGYADFEFLHGNATFAGAVNLGTGVIFPTSDPGVAGQWWDSSGTLTKSSG